MLSSGSSAAGRQAVLRREQEFNSILARVCKNTSRCRWDHGALFNFKFTPADVSTVDYFHPSLLGQGHGAAVEWAAGYWPAA
jgi:hypothetical protein